MHIRRFTLAILVLFTCFGCGSPQEATTDAPDVSELFKNYYEDRLKLYPLESTTGGDRRYNDTLTNYISDEFLSAAGELYGSYQEQASSFPIETLDDEQALYLKILEWETSMKKEGIDHALPMVTSPLFGMPNVQVMPLNQIFSFHLYMGQLASGGSIQPFETAQDYENWLSRLDDYLLWLETAQINMRRGISQGVVFPTVIIERMIAQLTPFIEDPLETHVFYAPIRNLSDDLAPVEQTIFTEKYAKFINEELRPAYIDLQTFLSEEYLPAGTETSGIGALPNGKEAYEYMIRYHTTTDLTADEIHELGKKEVARISADMEAIKNQIGFEGDLKAFFAHVRSNPDLMPYTDPQEVLDHFNAIHEKMKPQLATLFDLTPKSQFEVRRTEAFREASASAEYNAGSKDGSRPGIFYVPIPNIKAYNNFGDESLFLHEAIPGHHYQISLQQENPNLPEFLHVEGIGVYVEGWALYCESLGSELGLYEDPYQYFGMLSAEMHRAIRLVVDTGIHSKGWTREEAIQYSLDHEAESEASITAEIERYMVGPGQALSYKTGQLKIRELRARAEESLGDKFDIREFHNQVLNTGSLPLVLLEEKIDRWIAATM